MDYDRKDLQGRTTLFKTMFGSRLYGTNTPQSDIDWKEIFLPKKSMLLTGRQVRNVVITTGGDKTRNTKDDVDQEFIPIQVFAKDFIGGQTYAVELAFAALAEEHLAGQEVYDLEFLDFVHELTEKFLTSNIKAMIGYAMNQAQIYGIKGTRLASVRKFTDKLHAATCSGEFSGKDKLEVIDSWLLANEDKYLFKTTYENMDKKHPGVSVLEKVYPYSITIEEAIIRTEGLMGKYGSRAAEAEAANGMDWKATSHAVRITQQAIKLLREHRLQFPFPKENVEQLLMIKRGELSVEEAKALLEGLMDELDKVKDTTTLPSRDVKMEQEFDQWLEEWMFRFYQ